jgi:hypothetical protein
MGRWRAGQIIDIYERISSENIHVLAFVLNFEEISLFGGHAFLGQRGAFSFAQEWANDNAAGFQK